MVDGSPAGISRSMPGRVDPGSQRVVAAFSARAAFRGSAAPHLAPDQSVAARPPGPRSDSGCSWIQRHQQPPRLRWSSPRCFDEVVERPSAPWRAGARCRRGTARRPRRCGRRTTTTVGRPRPARDRCVRRSGWRPRAAVRRRSRRRPSPAPAAGTPGRRSSRTCPRQLVRPPSRCGKVPPGPWLQQTGPGAGDHPRQTDRGTVVAAVGGQRDGSHRRGQHPGDGHSVQRPAPGRGSGPAGRRRTPSCRPATSALAQATMATVPGSSAVAARPVA